MSSPVITHRAQPLQEAERKKKFEIIDKSNRRRVCGGDREMDDMNFPFSTKSGRRSTAEDIKQPTQVRSGPVASATSPSSSAADAVLGPRCRRPHARAGDAAVPRRDPGQIVVIIVRRARVPTPIDVVRRHPVAMATGTGSGGGGDSLRG